MRISVLYGQQVDRIEPLVTVARWCSGRAARLWLGQSVLIETHAALAAVAGHGVGVETGTCVALAPLRTPADALHQARSVAKLMGRPVQAGYGIGSQRAAEALLGRRLSKPGSYLKDYLEQIRDLQSAEPYRSDPHQVQVDLGCGVLRPRMARHAGMTADFAVTWLTPLQYLVDQLQPALAAGARTVGRRTPRTVCVVPVAVARDGRNPLRLAVSSCGNHLRQPHYADMLRKAGVHLTGARHSDLKAALNAGLFTYGSPDEIATVIQQYARAGIDEVVLNAGSVVLEHGLRAGLQDLEDIFAALATRLAAMPGTARPAAAVGA